MIGGSDYDDIAWQLIKLHQKKRDDTLDFACLMSVAAFFSNGVEFVKKENAGASADVVEKPPQACICLTKVASD